jgi:hypothetical protein
MKVSLYNPTLSIKTKEDFPNQVACLHNWDTKEIVDGYTIDELEIMKDMLDDAINKMKSNCNSAQLLLFK